MSDSVRACVLIVEDNADTREVLERVLQIRGYDVVVARDGIEALAHLQRGGMPAAVILDLAMPHMDGITFSKRLRADDRWAHIPVIVYTAMPTKRLPTANAVFRKGSDDPQRLLDLLAQLCSLKH
jgi:CheY-like chemotaxis protein